MRVRQPTIRPYVATDAGATIDIFLGAIRAVASRDYNDAQIEAWAQVDDPVAWNDRRIERPTWLALDGIVPAGFADLKPSGCIDMMFVHPRYQGLGIATALLEKVETAARRQGIRRLWTEASLTARPFFERRGFIVLAAQRVVKRGQTLDNFRMEKALP